tara:strand:+ start:146 stop:571 length:426 start_codon:yes stop_codon:yes gene_type:complete
VAIDDVVAALMGAIKLDVERSAWFDIPGPSSLSGKEILEKTAQVMGLRQPLMVSVPLLNPRLSSLWLRLMTRAQWSIAREVVVGLTEDLLAQDARFWDMIGHSNRLTFSQAAERALKIERSTDPVEGIWGVIERTLSTRSN